MQLLLISALCLPLFFHVSESSPPYFGWRPNPSGWRSVGGGDSDLGGAWISRNRNALIRERGRSPFGGAQIYYVVEPKEEVAEVADDNGQSIEEVFVPVVVDPNE
jgi:hypothetical protein